MSERPGETGGIVRYQGTSDDMRECWREEAVEALTTAMRQAPGTVVTFYPTWTLRHLAVHVIQVHRMACAALREGGDQRPASAVDVDAAMALDSVAASLELVVPQLRSSLEGCRHGAVWTPTFHTAPAFWRRRMLSEAVLHRWDAEAALVRAWLPAGDLALELVDEFLDSRIVPGAEDPPRGLLRLTTGDVEWTVPLAGGADVTVIAAPADLWLWLNRRPVRDGAVRVEGQNADTSRVEAMLDGLGRPSA